MKQALIAVIFLWIGCVGTDSFDDELINLRIESVDTQLINNAASALRGENIQFIATGENDRGTSYESPVTWHSTNEAVARIDSSGEVLANTIGQSQIYATQNGLESNRVTISVVASANDVAIIEVEIDNLNLSLADTLTLRPRALNVDGNPITGATFTFESSDEEVITVRPDGFVEAIGEGIADVIVTSGGKSTRLEIQVASNLERTGTFRGVNGYTVRGSVTLSLNDDGNVVITFGDDFQSNRGPGLYVYLGTGATTASYEVERLRSTSGADTYVLPSDITLEQFDHVLIYCKPFGIPFGTAQLSEL